MEALRRRINHWRYGRYADVVTEIENLRTLDRGWNGYRAGRIVDAAQQAAITLVSRLGDLPGRMPAPTVAPTPNGGVALCWPARREVQIIFLARGGEYSVAERGKEDIIDAGPIDHVDLLKDVVQVHVQ